MAWKVFLKKKAAKQIKDLPNKTQKTFKALKKDIGEYGPARGNWPNYSKLSGNQHHCHLKKSGKPTYVAVWEVVDNEIRIVEVSYVGTREKAPY